MHHPELNEKPKRGATPRKHFIDRAFGWLIWLACALTIIGLFLRTEFYNVLASLVFFMAIIMGSNMQAFKDAIDGLVAFLDGLADKLEAIAKSDRGDS